MSDHIEKSASGSQDTGESSLKSDKMYRVFYDAMSEGAGLYEIIYDETGEAIDYWIRDVNPAYTAITGLAREEVVGHRATEIYPGDIPHFLDIYAKVVETGQPTKFETLFQPLNKHFSVSVFSPGKGLFATTFYDITERIRTEAALRESENRYRSLVENAPMSITVTTFDGRVLYSNEAGVRLLGYPIEENDQIDLQTVYKNSEDRIRMLHQLKTQGIVQGFETELRQKNGAIIQGRLSATPVQVEGQDVLLTLIEDITERIQTEEALRENEQLLASVLEMVPVGICLTDEDGCYTLVNDTYCDIYDFDKNEIIGQHFSVIMPPGQLELAKAYYAKMLAGDMGIPVERKRQRKDGTIVWIEAANALLSHSNGKRSIITVVRDITERKQAEEALRRERDLLHQVTQTSPVGITVVNRAGKIIFANAQAEKVMGLTKDEITARDYNASDWRITDYEGKPFPEQDLPFVRVKTTGQPVTDVRHAIEWPNGRRVLLSINAAPLFDNTGDFDGMVSTIADITTMVQAEVALKESQQMLREVLNTIPVRVFWKDRDSIYLGCNQQFAQDAGIESTEAVVGKTDFDFAFASYADLYRADDRQVIETGTPKLEFEEILVHPDGSQSWVQTSKAPLRDTQGNIIGVLGVYADITQRKQVQEALRESETRYRAVTELISDFAYTYKRLPDGTWEADWVTEGSFTRLTGYDWKETASIFKMYHPDDLARVQQDVETAHQGKPSEGEYRIITQRGETRWIYLRRHPVWDASGKELLRYYGVAQDITARKQAEEALRQSEARYRIISELISDYAYSYERLPDGSWRTAWITEDSYQRLTGYTWQETTDTYVICHPDEIERVRQEVSDTKNGKVTEGEYRIITKSGETRWIYLRRQPIWDTSGKELLGYYGVAQDITARKQAEDFLRRRDAILQGVSSAAEIFLKTADWRQDINTILEILGRAANVDRVTIFEKTTTDSGQTVTSLRYVWAAAGIQSHQDDPRLQNTDYMKMGYPSFVKRLEQKQFIYGHTRDRPPEERVGHQMWGIQSFINMPIIIQSEMWGTISFHMVREERAWHSTEVEALKAAADMLGTVIERQQAQTALQRYTERLAILRQIDRSILAAESPTAIAEAALHYIRKLVDCSRASVTTFDLEHNQATILAVHINGETRLETGNTVPLMLAQDRSSTFQANAIFAVNDLTVKSELSPLERKLQQEGICTYINIPLHYQDKLIGSLNLGRNTPEAFLPEDIEIATELADQLAIAIQQARLHEQIQRHAAELEQRVWERTAELEKANEQLLALSQAKDEFVSNVSHELRTPITSLQLRQDLLAAQPQSLAYHLAVLRRETSRLAHIIDDLLQLSRLDQGRADLELLPVNLNNLVQEYVMDRSPVAEEKGLILSFTPTSNLPIVKADHNLLGQVLSVLLTNALNYTPSGGAVSVSTQVRQDADQRWVGFQVKDTGPGILPQEQEQLFTRFFRGSVGRRSEVSGTGLGLAIAAEIIERHYGEIEVESTGIPGEGATFSVWLMAQYT